MTPDISLAVIADTDDTAVFSVELADRVVDCVAAVFAQSSDNLVL